LDELAERPGAELVDFEAQRTKPYAVFDLQAGMRLMRRERFELSARASLLNIGDESYAYNFGNPFSGTHFGAPRTARLDLRLALR
jgi:outer membrane receptor for Fe3+-dicitrate